MSIATELEAAQTNLAEIKSVIESKGGTVGNTGLHGVPAEINSIPSGGGGGGITEKDINFWDYDGTLLYSYTHAEIQSLSELPAVPDHSAEGIASDGWTHTLAYLKTTYYAHVGACYKSAHSSGDRSTLLVVTIEEQNQTLKLYLNGTNVVVDWGDGTVSAAASYVDGVGTGPSHTFTSTGTYTIAIYSTEATYDISLGKKTSSTEIRSLLGGIVSSNGTSWSTTASAYVVAPTVKMLVVGQALVARGGLANVFSLEHIIISRSCISLADRAFYNTGVPGKTKTLIVPPSVAFANEGVGTGRTGIGYNSILETVIAPIVGGAVTALYFIGNIKRIEPLSTYNRGSGAMNLGFVKRFKVRGTPDLNIAAAGQFGVARGIASNSEEVVFDNNTAGLCLEFWGLPLVSSNGESRPRSLPFIKLYDFRALNRVFSIVASTSYPDVSLRDVIRPDAVIVVPDALYADWKADTNWSAVANQIIKASDYEAS